MVYKVAVVKGLSALIHLGVLDWALRVPQRYGLFAPLDDKARTSQLRSQPPKASNSWALLVKGPLGCLVAIICHVGSRLSTIGEIVQFGALDREFAESANTKPATPCARVG